MSSAATQGVATATGLQGSFSWAGVAAATVAAGVGERVGGDLPGLEGKGLSASNIASHTGVGAASLIASAATRSAITGSSFGRAVEAGLPDVIGQVIGRAIGSRLADGPSRPIQSGGSGRVIDGSGKIPGLTFVPEALDPLVFDPVSSLTTNYWGESTIEWLTDLTFGTGTYDTQVRSRINAISGEVNDTFNEIVVTGNRLADQAVNTLGEAVDMAINVAIRQAANTDIGRTVLLARAIAPTTNRLSADVSAVREDYIGLSEGLRASAPLLAPTLNTLDVSVGVVSGLVQGGLGLPQVVGDPLGTVQGLVSAASNGIRTLANTPSSVLAQRALTAVSNTSVTRANFISGEVLSAFVPAATIARAGTLARAGTTARVAAERGAPRVSTLVDTVDAPNPLTGAGYGVNNPPVRISGDWSRSDIYNAVYGRSPRGLGGPHLHHADQMPGAGIHEVLPADHLGNSVLHPNTWNQGVTRSMRTQDANLHWWYRAREQGADAMFPNHIYD